MWTLSLLVSFPLFCFPFHILSSAFSGLFHPYTQWPKRKSFLFPVIPKDILTKYPEIDLEHFLSLNPSWRPEWNATQPVTWVPFSPMKPGELGVMWIGSVKDWVWYGCCHQEKSVLVIWIKWNNTVGKTQQCMKNFRQSVWHTGNPQLSLPLATTYCCYYTLSYRKKREGILIGSLSV